MSNSVWPHRWQPTRLPRPWDSPGKNTGVGCHFLLQCMKVKSETEVALSCPTLGDPMDCSLPGSSVHGIFQATVLEWGAIAFSVSPPIHAHKYLSTYLCLLSSSSSAVYNLQCTDLSSLWFIFSPRTSLYLLLFIFYVAELSLRRGMQDPHCVMHHLSFGSTDSPSGARAQ